MMQSRRIACPSCHALNEAVVRLHERPRCRGCGRLLFAGQPVELGVDNVDAHLLRSELPLLAKFWAPWCGPCQLMAPHLVRAASMLEPRVRLAEINVQVEPTLGQRYGVRAIPTMILFDRGQELARLSGALSAEAIVQWTQEVLARYEA